MSPDGHQRRHARPGSWRCHGRQVGHGGSRTRFQSGHAVERGDPCSTAPLLARSNRIRGRTRWPWSRRALADSAARKPDDVAITCADRSITWGELESRTNRLARAFQDMGVTKNSFVTVGLPNSIEFFEACIAAWKLGATPQPISYRLPDRERQAIVELADSSLVVGAEPAAHPNPGTVIPVGWQPDPVDRRLAVARCDCRSLEGADIGRLYRSTEADRRHRPERAPGDAGPQTESATVSPSSPVRSTTMRRSASPPAA